MTCTGNLTDVSKDVVFVVLLRAVEYAQFNGLYAPENNAFRIDMFDPRGIHVLLDILRDGRESNSLPSEPANTLKREDFIQRIAERFVLSQPEVI